MSGETGGRCWWRGHSWGRWEQIAVRVVPDGYEVTRQERTCARCGRTKWAATA